MHPRFIILSFGIVFGSFLPFKVVQAQFFIHFPYDSLGVTSRLQYLFNLRKTSNGKIIFLSLKEQFNATMLDLSEKKVVFLGPDTNILNSFTTVEYSIKDSSLWAFTLNGIIARRKKNKWSFFRTENMNPNYFNYDLLRSGDINYATLDHDSNRIYVTGGSQNVMVLEPEKELIKPFFEMPTSSFPSGSPAVYKSPNSNQKIIFGWPNVVGFFTDSTVLVQPNTVFGVNSGTIRNFQSNDNETFWFFTDELKRWKNGTTFNLFQSLGRIPPNATGFAYGLEKKGGLWFGDMDGLYCYRPKKGLKEYIRFEYPFTFGFKNVVVDSNNNKWVLAGTEITLVKDVKTRILQADTAYFACQGNNIFLKQTTQTYGDGIENHRWILGDGRVVFGDSVSIGFSTPGRYRIMLTALDSNGSKDHDSIWISIKPIPVSPILSIPGDTINTCTLPISIAVSNADLFSKLVWKSNSDSIAGPSFSADTIGKVSLMAYPNFIQPPGLCYTKADFLVNKKRLKPIQLKLIFENGDFFTGPAIYSPKLRLPNPSGIEVKNENEAENLLQVFANQILLPEREKGNFDFTFTRFDPVFIQAKVASPDGCLAKDSLLIKPLPFEFSIPNLISVNSDQKNDRFIISGLEDYLNYGGKAKLSIFNRWGKQIFASEQYKNDWPSQNSIEDGTYFYRLEIEGIEHFTGWITAIKP